MSGLNVVVPIVESGSGVTTPGDALVVPVRWYQIGVPFASTIMAKRPEPEATITLPMKYQPGVGLPSAGFGLAVTRGKS